MKFKTLAQVMQEELVLTDGRLEKLGDCIIAYHALREAIAQHNLKPNVDFKTKQIGYGPIDQRLQVIFNKEVTPVVIQTIEKAYPGLVIQGKEFFDLDSSVNSSLTR
ncbi:hypothetical protein [Legionella sp.]|uniref:hypothetical protein n=1 Tax=Legionella sp. TaxID=459 RepID=UPI00322057D4